LTEATNALNIGRTMVDEMCISDLDRFGHGSSFLDSKKPTHSLSDPNSTRPTIKMKVWTRPELIHLLEFFVVENFATN